MARLYPEGLSDLSPTVAEMNSPVEAKKRQIFDALIEGRLGDTINPSKVNLNFPPVILFQINLLQI